LIAVVFPALVHAMQNEPADFQGIKWGASLENYRSTLRPINETGDSGHYRRTSDRPLFAGTEVRRISYHFFKGRFVSGSYLSVGTTDLKRILAHLTERHGEPQRANHRHKIYEWQGAQRGVTVSCDISISCFTEFYDRELRDQEHAEEAATQGGTKPKSDND
jgi:hypothetical protein